MKVVSWNLNGLLSCIKNKSFEQLSPLMPDVICLQEIRTRQEPEILPGYNHIWNHADRDGYSGTATLTKLQPLKTIYGFNDIFPDPEGRLITLEFPEFFLINAYAPNSQKTLNVTPTGWSGTMLCESMCSLYLKANL